MKCRRVEIYFIYIIYIDLLEYFRSERNIVM